MRNEMNTFYILNIFCKDNMHLLLGILLGVYLAMYATNEIGYEQTCPETKSYIVQEVFDNSINGNSARVTTKKIESNKRTKLIRPRYYSMELGIRSKLFVGIFSAEERVNTQAVHINKTIGHLVDKIKFFITAQYKAKSKFNLTGLVGFTDSRTKFRPFQVIKYIGDTVLNDYDYYFLANDYTFVNAYRLKTVVNKISVSMDVYLGTKVKDGAYCDLEAGIILSNSVLKAMRTHLEWCMLNAVSDDVSENIGRCVYHSLGLQCQDNIQGQRIGTFKLKHFELSGHLHELNRHTEFQTAATVYPVLHKDFYSLSAYMTKQEMNMLHGDIKQLFGDLASTWPPGQRVGGKATTRFELPQQYYFNMTHAFFPDDFTAVRKHTTLEILDIKNVLEKVRATNNVQNMEFDGFVNGYRKFDLSRGIDYILDLSYIEQNTKEKIIRRFEVFKPLGSVEFIHVPYVTENRKVTILLPVQENEVTVALTFVNDHYATIIDQKEKAFVMFIFLYQSNSHNKGQEDVFVELKNVVTKLSSKYKDGDMRMGWVSIRLPNINRRILTQDIPVLQFALVDLALKKVGLQSLVLMVDVYCNMTGDFLNRVRMNTIEGFQIFSPIPYVHYNSYITGCNISDINKSCGHFDREEYRFISFYGKDYVTARKKQQIILPLVRTDNDILNLINQGTTFTGNIYDMFLTYHEELHCMRATEMNLRVKYHEPLYNTRKSNFIGSTSQLAKLFMIKKDQIEELQ